MNGVDDCIQIDYIQLGGDKFPVSSKECSNVVDEVRMYDRALTEREIKLLCEQEIGMDLRGKLVLALHRLLVKLKLIS